MFFNKYPYTDFHELNLDWILGEIRRLTHAMSDFEAANHIKPCGVWDITKQYEAWSVVTDGGAGYISTRPVPVGIDISNQDYWTEIVDYDAFWGTLNLRVQALENSMSTLTGTTIPGIQNNVSSLTGRVNTIENTTIPGLDGRLNTLENTTIPGIQSNITSLQNDVSLMKNHKYIWIADSYAGTSGYVIRVESKLGLTRGVDSFCNAVGGEGFTKGPGGNGFLDELQQHAAGMSADVKNSITDIFVLGGANDAEDNQSYGFNTIGTNFASFVNYAHTNFPNAKIHVGFIGFCRYDSSTLENRTQDNLEIMCYYYKDTALENGCSYINNIEYTTRWLNQDTGSADGLHPNNDGGIVICQGIVNYILGAGVDVTIEHIPCATSNVIGNTTANATFSMHNSHAFFDCGEMVLTHFTGQFYGGNAASLTRTHLFNFGHVFFNKKVHAKACLYANGHSPYAFPVDIQLYGDEATLVVEKADGNGWNGIAASDEALVLSPFYVMFDSIYLA